MTAWSKKLAIFIPDLVVGGAERSMLKLAAGIAERGYAVDFVLSRAYGPFLAEVPESVRLVDLKGRRVLTSLPALVRYLRQEQPAAMLAVLHANLIALWARRLAGTHERVVVSERNMLTSEARQYSDLRMRMMPKLARKFYTWSDCIVAVSKSVADDLIQTVRIPGERVRVIYNPIVTPELREKAQAPLQHAWFEPGEPPLVLSVGRLCAQKDFFTMIRAFDLVRRARPARLLILGEGEDRPALEALIEELGLKQDVSLPGFNPNPYPYMTRASVFVLSSRWEGLPGVLIEALYCGAPVIATDCPGGSREILAGGQYGKLVPAGDTAALAGAIEAALDGKMARPPRESWRPFEMESVVNQYLQVLFGT